MNFSILSYCHKKWLDILVIGKTIERDGKKYHIVGMTLSDEAKLYIIEPYDKREPIIRKGIYSHRAARAAPWNTPQRIMRRYRYFLT